MKIAFICVNYNNSNYTRDYINSALKFRNHCSLKVIIIDNASEKDDMSNSSGSGSNGKIPEYLSKPTIIMCNPNALVY